MQIKLVMKIHKSNSYYIIIEREIRRQRNYNNSAVQVSYGNKGFSASEMDDCMTTQSRI